MVGAQCFGAMDATYQLNGHPYEWMDPISKHGGAADYMWPWCEENGTAVTAPDGTATTPPAGTNCASMIVAPVRAPAYSTIISATFYAPPANATYAFPASYRGGMFMTLHGSWHENTSGVQVAVPEVVFVPITVNDLPAYPTDWSNGGSPYQTWARNSSGNPAPFMNGFQQGGTRVRTAGGRCRRSERQSLRERRQRKRHLPHSAGHGSSERAARYGDGDGAGLVVATMTSRRFAKP